MRYPLNDKLKCLRINKNLTQTDLGNYLNMTRQGYAHYEKGSRSPDNQTILRLANLYDIGIKELIDENELPTEIAYLFDPNPYTTDKKYKTSEESNTITIKVSTYEKRLVSLFRQLDEQEQIFIISEVENIIEEKE